MTRDRLVHDASMLVQQGYSLAEAWDIVAGRLPRRPNGKYFSAKPVVAKGPRQVVLGKPYSRGVLKREMETHPTMRNRMIGMLKWAGKKHGVALRDDTIVSMLGKAAKNLPKRLQDIKRLADRVFYAGMRKMYGMPGLRIVEPEPAKGRKAKKVVVKKVKIKKRRTA